MSIPKINQHFRIALFVSILIAIISCTSPEKGADGLTLEQLLPDSISGWRSAGQHEKYDYDGIFKYMNGAGEIYRMYDYKSMEVARLEKNGQPGITVEMFDMGTPADAFGVFAHGREGDEAGLGEGSEYRAGLLYFYQGRYFFSLMVEEETPETRKVLFELARHMARQLKPHGSRPEILEMLPKENLRANTVRYFHYHRSLNYHYYLASDNILKLNDKTDAVLAQYAPDNAYLLIIAYPDSDAALKAYESFVSGYIPEAVDGQYEIEPGKWVRIERMDNHIMVVFDASDKQRAGALIDEVKANLTR